jgi:hypothetical protein
MTSRVLAGTWKSGTRRHGLIGPGRRSKSCDRRRESDARPFDEELGRCGGVICFSLLTYHFIELPFIRLSKRIAPMGSAPRKPVSFTLG